jgi:hypothetical protein
MRRDVCFFEIRGPHQHRVGDLTFHRLRDGKRGVQYPFDTFPRRSDGTKTGH